VAFVQGSLLEPAESTRLGPLAGIERSQIGHGAWTEYLPEWMKGAARVFDDLSEKVAWRTEKRPMYDRIVDVPRLVSRYDEHMVLPHAVLEDARAALNGHYGDELGEEFVTAGLCLYRDGRDSVAWHGDTLGRGATQDTMVAIVSLGAPRRLLLRPRHGGTAIRFELGLGDLFVMGGSCQRTWEHSVPKTTRPVGPRMSVQFRALGVG
jgi:alkylated DNA repair dioxygenase AlkB